MATQATRSPHCAPTRHSQRRLRGARARGSLCFVCSRAVFINATGHVIGTMSATLKRFCADNLVPIAGPGTNRTTPQIQESAYAIAYFSTSMTVWRNTPRFLAKLPSLIHCLMSFAGSGSQRHNVVALRYSTTNPEHGLPRNKTCSKNAESETRSWHAAIRILVLDSRTAKRLAYSIWQTY